jgi:hypothetical protein
MVWADPQQKRASGLQSPSAVENFLKIQAGLAERGHTAAPPETGRHLPFGSGWAAVSSGSAA